MIRWCELETRTQQCQRVNANCNVQYRRGIGNNIFTTMGVYISWIFIERNIYFMLKSIVRHNWKMKIKTLYISKHNGVLVHTASHRISSVNNNTYQLYIMRLFSKLFNADIISNNPSRCLACVRATGRYARNRTDIFVAVALVTTVIGSYAENAIYMNPWWWFSAPDKLTLDGGDSAQVVRATVGLFELYWHRSVLGACSIAVNK